MVLLGPSVLVELLETPPTEKLVIDNPFRKVLPRATGPLIALYAALRLTPNHVTVLGFVFALIAAFATAKGWAFPAIVIWWLGRLLDGTDGIYARATGRVTDFGGYLDIVLDMASYSAMIIGFAIWKPELGILWLLILLLYVLCITSALALGAIEEKRHMAGENDRSLRLAAGLAEGGETGIAYTVMLLIPAALAQIAIVWIVILAITVIARTRLAAKITKIG